MRLIDADALNEKINAFYDSLFVGCVSSDLIAYASGVDSIIDNAPTVEINDKSLEITRKSIELGRRVGKLEGKLERPKGEWIMDKEHTSNSLLWYKCNKCGVYHSPTNYCPNCGADMEKGGAT